MRRHNHAGCRGRSGAVALIFTVGLFAALIAGPAGAQSTPLAPLPITPGQPVQGTEWVNRGSLIPGVSNRIALQSRCYQFEAPVGSTWSVEARVHGLPMSAAGAVIVARSCTDTGEVNASFGSFGGPARLQFKSGGGLYAVRFYLNIDGGSQLPWTLSVTPIADRGRLTALLPGTVVGPAGNASRAATGSPAPTGAFRDCPSCPEMTPILAGSFMMGSPADEEGRSGAEGPHHVVTIGAAFALGTYEVTFDEYDACVAEQGCRAVQDAGWGRGRRPAINVTYQDAQRYVGWLSQKTGQSYFLPSEAEWEYAARAGGDTAWSTGAAIISDDANILNQFGKTTPAGGFAANAFGLFDMHGNVAEWTQDCIDTGYVGAPNDGSVAAGGDCNAQAVVRGGSHASLPEEVRSAARRGVARGGASNQIGFRVARAL